MAEITMPKLSDTMTEGVVVRWHKKKGDVVATGDVLAEIETDKATMEMEAFDDGVLKEIYVPEGQKVSVGERIALIGNEHESSSAPVQKVDALPKRIVSQEKAARPQAQARRNPTRSQNSERRRRLFASGAEEIRTCRY